MTALMNHLTQWWSARAPREQRLLQLLGVLLATLFFWYGVLTPLGGLARNADARYARAAHELQDIEQAASLFAREPRQAGPGAVPLAEIVSSAAAETFLLLGNTRAETENQVTIEAHPADPARLFSWIKQLQESHGVVVTNFTATRDSEGLLDTEIVLTRSAP
ncbi:MAG: type secretion system protein [Pseudomonadota bacterium]|jgi:general secretion pathway protein M